MNDNYAIPTLTIQDLNDLSLQDTLTTIEPLNYSNVTIGGSLGINGTSATDLQWGGSGGYTQSVVPNVTISTITGGSYKWSATPNVWTTSNNTQP